jgi:rhodanese-related sulfurtransferase
MCGVGKRSLTAMLLLKAQGYERVKSLRGGMAAWKEAGYPLKVT